MMRENKLSLAFTWFLVLAAFLLPVFFLPHLFNPFYNSKLALMFLIAFACVFAFVFQSLHEKKWQLIKTPFTIPLLGFVVSVVVASLVGRQYPDKQFLGMGGIFLSFATIVLIAPSLLSKIKLNQKFVFAANLAAGLLSILSILQFFGYGLPSLINQISVWKLSNDLSFSLTGMTLISIQFLSVIVLSNIFDQKAWKNSLFNKIVTIIAAIALGINIWAVLPGGQASFQTLSLKASASIAKDSLVVTKNALFGYGPDSYENAFNILKPIWFNGLDYWQASFDAAFNLPLTLIVSTGIIGLLAYLLFLWKVFGTVQKAEEQNSFLKIFILGALIWQFFSPINLVMFTLLAIALAFFIASSTQQYQKFNFSGHHSSNLENPYELNKDQVKLAQIKNYVLVGVNLILIAISSLAFYAVGKSLVAYNSLYKSQALINENNVIKVYEEYGKAKNLAPKLDFIRRGNALINLDIAVAMSNKTDITATEQEQVLQLINQAINEAKAATVLDPLNYQNWYVLAQIYMQLLEVTEQAKQETFNALAKAIVYNPSNPELRILMGQLFLSNKDYVNAITFFSQAVERKGDLTVAHYYLAQALEANKQWDDAKVSLNNVLALLEKDSEDYKTVEKELKLVDAEIEAAKKNSNGTKTDEQKSTQTPAASPSKSPVDEDETSSASSNLSELLDKQETEDVIQEGALTPDQNLVEN